MIKTLDNPIFIISFVADFFDVRKIRFLFIFYKIFYEHLHWKLGLFSSRK